ncbi:alpha/beta fold hydrolase [Methylobacterium nonmethylotrophicum]|uniref:Alpha/beta fold hydrolase n=2 Tax=Methylobacterium nonmethylotrophicum TaxID=1141884 RepID=A0A4Z0NHP6_9HYPH|nr:alpha/beta fold hydrolase [Methylobacterium nonmethylotrophicum]
MVDTAPNRSLRTTRVRGCDIAFRDEGHGDPVLLIHGLAGDHSAWDPQIEAWSRRLRVIAPDSRGAGRSTQTDAPTSTAEMAGDFLALMDDLGLERVHVVGRSMGGSIGQHMALAAPERILSLAMLASCARFDPFGRRCLENMRDVLAWRGSWADHARHSVQNFVSPAFYNAEPERAAAIERLIASSSRLQACYVQQNYAVLAHDTLDRLHEIRCPVLILSGGRDPLCGPTATRWMVERLPTAEWVEFEQSSHFFLMEEPDRFMAVMARWFDRVCTTGIVAAA